MKKAALLFVLSLAGYSGFAQESNAVSNEIFYGLEKKIVLENTNEVSDQDLFDLNILIISELDSEEAFVINTHEFFHESNVISEAFEIKEGSYTLNEYAMISNQ
ncbi:MAG: hypothetical protein U5K51_14105 [Flavobacteriaceae bacterium]|nr:hypothetical protein [Flavobacteriaceae bacterium]